MADTIPQLEREGSDLVDAQPEERLAQEGSFSEITKKPLGKRFGTANINPPEKLIEFPPSHFAAGTEPDLASLDKQLESRQTPASYRPVKLDKIFQESEPTLPMQEPMPDEITRRQHEQMMANRNFLRMADPIKMRTVEAELHSALNPTFRKTPPPKTDQFDVLASQIPVPTDPAAIPIPSEEPSMQTAETTGYFPQSVQPTHIEPLQWISPAKNKEGATRKEKFYLSREFLTYIDTLIEKNSRLSTLEFDLKLANSMDMVKADLGKYLTGYEYDKAVALLEGRVRPEPEKDFLSDFKENKYFAPKETPPENEGDPVSEFRFPSQNAGVIVAPQVESDNFFEDKKFRTDERILTFIKYITENELDQRKKRILTIMGSQLEAAKSERDVKEILERVFFSEAITQDEHDELIGFLREGEQSTLATENPPVEIPKIKINRKIDIPTPKFSGTVKVTLDRKPQEFYTGTERIEDVLKKQEEGKSFQTMSEKIGLSARNSFDAGKIEEAVGYIRDIQDEDIKINLIGDIVEECVKRKDFNLARRFLNNIPDDKYRFELEAWMKSIELGFSPKPQVEVPKADATETKIPIKISRDEDLTLQQDTASVLPAADLNLKEKRPEPLGEKLVEKEEVPLGPKTSEEQSEVDRRLEAELIVARDEYVRQYVDWEYKTRNSKRLFARTLLDLGVTKAPPERLSLKTSALDEAREEYLKAKAKSSMNIVGDREKLLGSLLDERLILDFKKQERREEKERLDREFANQEEKSKLGKVFEKSAQILKKSWGAWTKLPIEERLAVSTAIMASGGLVFGTLTLAGVAGYSAVRVAGAAGGMLTGQLTGLGVDKLQRRGDEKRLKKLSEEYSRELNPDNVMAKEEALLHDLEKEKNLKNRQRLYKAGAMIGAGAAVGIGTNIGISHLKEAAANMDSSLDLPKVPKPPSPSIDTISGKNIPDQIHSASVEVSPKGSIRTIHDFQAKIAEQYGGADHVPEEIKRNLLDRSDVELAKQFKFYDPKQGLSSVIQKGESLELNEAGNVVYHHLDGRSEILLDTKTGLSREFTGRMQKLGEASPKIPTRDIPSSNEIPIEKIAGDLGTIELPQNSLVNLVENQNGKALVWNGTEIGHEQIFGSEKVMTLDEKFQNGPEYADARGAFAAVLDKNIPIESRVLPPIDFEGGKIHIIKSLDNPKGVSVLLNGKEIAKGVITDTGAKIEILKNLKGGWFLADNAYERAFKQASSIIKSSKINI